MTVPSPADFFSDIEVGRDHSGRPMIRPLGSPASAPLVPYTRASTLADYISDHRHIHRWEMRYLAKAMGKNPDLAELAAVESYSTGFDVPDDKSASGRRLDSIISRALDRVGIHEKADYGTAVHAATEPANPGPHPERMRADVAAFKEGLQRCGILLLATEVFVANDELQAAGTFDHLAWVPGLGVVILDKKTGRKNLHEFGVQFSVYANADVYNVKTHDRLGLEDLLRGTPFEGDGINREVGIAAMIRSGGVDFVEVDLEKGYEGAKAAARARDYVEDRSLGASATRALERRTRELRDTLGDALSEAGSVKDLEELWHMTPRSIWLDEHTSIAKARRTYLTTSH